MDDDTTSSQPPAPRLPAHPPLPVPPIVPGRYPVSPEGSVEFGRSETDPGWASVSVDPEVAAGGEPTRAGEVRRVRRRRRRLLTGVVVLAVLSASLVELGGWWPSSGESSTAARPVAAVSEQPLSAAEIASRMDSAIVDVTTTLGYQGAVAAGTGIIITSSGEVLTNNHVVSGATSVQVNISTDDAHKFNATVVGTDSTNDVALLKVQDLAGFTTAVLGDSSKVTVGQPVVAIGNALAIPGAPKVTEGQVSAVGRSITASDGRYGEQLQNLFQISADLSPGNSGGPLFDVYGRVIGINTAAGTEGGYQSTSTVGFAIPINDAKAIVSQIESGQSSGTVRVGPPAFLGVQLSDRLGRQFGAGAGSGAVISGVESGSPAESAGLVAGDTIVAFDGTTVTSSAGLAQVIGVHKPGDQATVTWVDRSGTRHTATVKLSSGPIA